MPDATPSLDAFEALCQQHDWTGYMSDDYRVWREHQVATTLLHRLLDQLTEAGQGEAARQVYDRYSPDWFPRLASATSEATSPST